MTSSLARKTKVKKSKEQVARSSGLKRSDFVFPGEKSSLMGGLIGTGFIFACVAMVAFFSLKEQPGSQKYYIPLYAIAWPIAAVLIGNWLAAKPRAAQLKKAGRQARVMSNNFSDLYKVLVRQSSLLGMKNPPDMYLVNDPHPVLYSLPSGKGTLIASTSLQESVSPEEFEALIAHEITHIYCKHVRLDLAQTFIKSANLGIKIGLFPVLLLSFFARAWAEFIDFTADRGALLITLRPAVVNAAMVKFAVARDPNAGISREELQAYLDGAGDITTDATQMERHFKVGQFMGSQPGLRERIEQLTDFVNEDQGKAALAKMAEIQNVNLGSIVMHKKSTGDDGIEHLAADEDEQGIPEQ